MRIVALTALSLALGACAVGAVDATTPTNTEPHVEAQAGIPVATTATHNSVPSTTSTTSIPTTTANQHARPDWLGTRLLPLRPDGHGEISETPPELVDRQLETLELIPPPDGEDFVWKAQPIPPDVLARSSWSDECPVALDDLTYLTMSHYGFDGRFHTGEMIVNSAVAEDVVEVFRKLHEARFPIEQMRVIAAEEIDAHPTGDFNDTTSFVCRPAVGSGSWSQHAYGLAIDINPFQNPYLKGDLVLPELASVYLDRDDVRPGMIFEGDVVTRAFDDIGWGWGGRWNSLDDWMHFSQNGR